MGFLHDSSPLCGERDSQRSLLHNGEDSLHALSPVRGTKTSFRNYHPILPRISAWFSPKVGERRDIFCLENGRVLASSYAGCDALSPPLSHVFYGLLRSHNRRKSWRSGVVLKLHLDECGNCSLYSFSGCQKATI